MGVLLHKLDPTILVVLQLRFVTYQAAWEINKQLLCASPVPCTILVLLSQAVRLPVHGGKPSTKALVFAERKFYCQAAEHGDRGQGLNLSPQPEMEHRVHAGGFCMFSRVGESNRMGQDFSCLPAKHVNMSLHTLYVQKIMAKPCPEGEILVG